MKLKDIFSLRKDKTKDSQIMLCKKCNSEYTLAELLEEAMICTNCGTYFRMNARQRIDYITDEGSFEEFYADLISSNLLSFPDYSDKLEKAKELSGENEAVICGTAKIGGIKVAIFVMDSTFMMGSMGTVVGEKITRLFEFATKDKLAVIGFTTSGGARMQEGILSLMQMAKVSGAVKRHSDKNLLYVAILTDPTTGGVTASFAMEADITIAEPKALIGFAGARVIQQTTGQELPKGFQRSEFLMNHGFLDVIESRARLKDTITKILLMHEVKK